MINAAWDVNKLLPIFLFNVGSCLLRMFTSPGLWETQSRADLKKIERVTGT